MKINEAIGRGFWQQVKMTPTCWLWRGPQRDGYGVWQGTGAHRLAYQHTYGFIPEGQVVRHICDVPLCVCPAHLELGSPKDNAQDIVDRRRAAALYPVRLIGDQTIVRVAAEWRGLTERQFITAFRRGASQHLGWLWDYQAHHWNYQPVSLALLDRLARWLLVQRSELVDGAFRLPSKG